MIGAVTGGVYARHSRLKLLVHDNGPPIRLDADFIQVEHLGVRCASHGHQQPISPQFPGVCVEHELLIGIADFARLRAVQYLDALGPESGFNGLAHGRVLPGKQPAARQNGHLAAQPGKRLGQFHRHGGTANDNQPVRNAVAGQCRGGRPVRRTGQAWNRGDGWPRAGTDERSVKAHLAFRAVGSRYLQCIGIDKTSLTLQDSDRRIVVKDALIFGVTKRLNPGLLLGQQAGPVNGGLGRRNTLVERTGAA